jgi:hypothetical protein
MSIVQQTPCWLDDAGLTSFPERLADKSSNQNRPPPLKRLLPAPAGITRQEND